MNDGNENQVAAEVVKKSPGKPRTRFTKTFKVLRGSNGEWLLVGRGKPKAGVTMGEVTLPFDYNRVNGVPNNATVTNEHIVKYEKTAKSVTTPQETV